MADYPQTRFDRVLDVVHDYLPVRAQTWIEDRAFLKQVKHVGQETERKFGAHIDGTIERFNRESAPVVAQVRSAVESTRATRDGSAYHWPNSDDLRKMKEEGSIPDNWIQEKLGLESQPRSYSDGFEYIESPRAEAAMYMDRAALKRKEGDFDDAKHNVDLARGLRVDGQLMVSPTFSGQPNFFDKSVIPVYQQQKPDVALVSLKDNVDYQQRKAWDAKQAQRAEAWSAASSVTTSARQETATNTMKLTT